LIKNSQSFGKKFQKTVGGIFFDSHCTFVAGDDENVQRLMVQPQNMESALCVCFVFLLLFYLFTLDFTCF